MSKYLRKELIDAISSRQALLLVGSGITIAATDGESTASWYGLIEHGLERAHDLRPDLTVSWLRDGRKLLKSRSTSDLIVAAQRVTSALREIPGNHYAKWLKDSIGMLQVTHPGILQALTDLKVPIATTNYDTLIDDYINAPPVTWKESPGVQEAFQSKSRAVVHLHGHWRDADSVVFGYESYGLAIGDIPSQALIRAMTSINSVIFIGAGLGTADPNFAAIMAWLKESLPDSRCPPTILLRESDVRKQYKDLTERGFNVLSYGEEFSDLELFLADLRKEVSETSTPTSGTRILGWDEVQMYLNRLHTRIRREFVPDLVVAMSGPGNFAPAYCWSLDPEDVPLVAAVTFPKRSLGDFRLRQFQEWSIKAGWVHYESRKWHVFLPNIVKLLPPASKILLFDDRVIGGRVQDAVALLLEAEGYVVKRAALVSHPEVAARLDYYEIKTEEDFLFPWGGKYGRSPVPRT
jgi:hypothetical protein